MIGLSFTNLASINATSAISIILANRVVVVSYDKALYDKKRMFWWSRSSTTVVNSQHALWPSWNAIERTRVIFYRSIKSHFEFGLDGSLRTLNTLRTQFSVLPTGVANLLFDRFSKGCLNRIIPGQKCMVFLVDQTNDFIYKNAPCMIFIFLKLCFFGKAVKKNLVRVVKENLLL